MAGVDGDDGCWFVSGPVRAGDVGNNSFGCMVGGDEDDGESFEVGELVVPGGGICRDLVDMGGADVVHGRGSPFIRRRAGSGPEIINLRKYSTCQHL